MEAIGAAVGTAVISAIIEKLTSFAVGEAVKVARSMSHSELIEELESLELKLKLIKNLLDDAESKQNKEEGVRAWLEELKDAAYDAEDVLDEYATDTAILRQRKGHVRKWMKGKVNTLSMKSKIKRINNRLNGLSDLIDKLGLQKLTTSDIEGNTSGSQGRKTSSLVDMDWPIIGRDGVQQEIIGLLKSDEIENITKKLPVLAIVGMGGLGKTSLARSVFQDNEVEKHFSLRIWVFVSQEFDLKGLLRKIIEYIYRDKGERESCKLTTLESLHDETKKLIENKKFLLILDDAWSEQKKHWEELLKPLKFGDNGSKVLVTTRNENVANSIDGHMDPIILGSMGDDSIGKILERCAFNGIDNPNNKEHLMNIGKQIVGKLKGSPLAAKTIGRLLGTKHDEDHWESILKSDLWKVEGQEEHDIIPSLLLSYHYLPTDLKCCFSLCSLFPKGHQISKEKLSYMWIAHDIFQVEHEKDLENLAAKAIQDLINRSLLFQDEDDDHVGMHDLIHDVSEFAAQEDHLHLTDNIKFEKHLTKKLRHLSFSNMNWESQFPCDKLRSLLAFGFSYDSIICKRVVNSWLHEAKCLRVLDLAGYFVDVLPNSIGNLKHLRCLNLSDTGISELPKSLTSLYNLQALWLKHCDDLEKLPDGMGNLVNLRCLNVSHTGISELPKSLTSLYNLQALWLEGCRSLNRLPDRMGNLVNLRLLSLKYCYDLRKLPDGIGNLVNLRFLSLESCHSLKELPDGIGNLVNLRFLSLESCYSLKELPDGIENLVNLRILKFDKRLVCTLKGIGRLSSLQELSCFDVDPKNGSGIEELENLNMLRVGGGARSSKAEELTSALLLHLINDGIRVLQG